MVLDAGRGLTTPETNEEMDDASGEEKKIVAAYKTCSYCLSSTNNSLENGLIAIDFTKLFLT